ncbi:MAG: hypothetical protein ACTS3F_00540 [Phycisphaerales bacterium]
MGTEELRGDYERMTGRSASAASSGSGIGGPLWSISHWILAKRDGVSLFATGLTLIIAAGLLIGVVFFLAVAMGAEWGNPPVAILAIGLQFLAWITGVVGLLTMLAGAIRVGANADHASKRG